MIRNVHLIILSTFKTADYKFRDSSDSKPHFYVLMLAGESQIALYSEDMEFPGTSWCRSFSYLLMEKKYHVRQSRRYKQFAKSSLYQFL